MCIFGYNISNKKGSRWNSLSNSREKEKKHHWYAHHRDLCWFWRLVLSVPEVLGILAGLEVGRGLEGDEHA